MHEPRIRRVRHALDRRVAPIERTLVGGSQQPVRQLRAPIPDASSRGGAALFGALLDGLEEGELKIEVIGKFRARERGERIHLLLGRVTSRVAQIARQRILDFGIFPNLGIKVESDG